MVMKLYCIRDDGKAAGYIKRGETYTLRNVARCPHCGDRVYRLDEVLLPTGNWCRECRLEDAEVEAGFAPDRFIPIGGDFDFSKEEDLYATPKEREYVYVDRKEHLA